MRRDLVDSRPVRLKRKPAPGTDPDQLSRPLRENRGKFSLAFQPPDDSHDLGITECRDEVSHTATCRLGGLFTVGILNED